MSIACMTVVRKILKSVILKAVSAGEDPIAIELPVGKARPSVVGGTRDTVPADDARGKRIGYPGAALGADTGGPKGADTAFGDGVGADGAGFPVVD